MKLLISRKLIPRFYCLGSVDLQSSGRNMDIQNKDRANRAWIAINAYIGNDDYGNPPNSEAVQDLITDLFHYADSQGMNIKEIQEFACGVFKMEKTEDSIQ